MARKKRETNNVFVNLKKYEDYLRTAYKYNYVRGVTSTELDEMIELGKQLGIDYIRKNCPRCNLEFIKRLGTIYYEKGV